jgi:hypothetical protein
MSLLLVEETEVPGENHRPAISHWQTLSHSGGPIRHNGAKKKLQLKHKNSLFTLQTFHYNYYWWSQSLLYRFGWEVSEEKIKMWKVNGRQTTYDGRQVMAKAHIASGKVSLKRCYTETDCVHSDLIIHAQIRSLSGVLRWVQFFLCLLTYIVILSNKWCIYISGDLLQALRSQFFNGSL